MGDTKYSTTRVRGRHRDAGPPGAAPRDALVLQQLAGNAAIADLVGGAQAKLRVGAVDDPAEAEADAVADQVVRSIRTGAGAALETTTGVTRQIQRRATGRAAAGQGDGALDGAVDAARAGGQPLPAATLTATGSAFGADFGDVRVHTGAAPSALNDAVDAHAFTVGNDIFFRDRVPDATDPLLAHELTHVIQQGGGAVHDHGSVLRRKETGSGGKLDLSKKETLEHIGLGGIDTEDEDVEDLENDLENLSGINEELVDDDFVEALGIEGDDANAVTVMGGVSDTVFAFMGIAIALGKAKADMTALEEAELFMELYATSVKGAAGVATIVSGAMGEKGGSKEIAGGLAGFGEVFSGIKETFGVVKKIVELANETDAKKAKTDQEKFRDAMEVITGLLEVAKSGVSAAKQFLDAFGSGASTALSNTIPGFAIALGAADIIVRSVDLVTAMVHSHQMRLDKQEFKSRLGGKLGRSSKKEAEAILTKHDAKRDRGEELTAEEEEEYDLAESYLASKGLQYINDKRRNRALLKMGVAMTKAAGDVATLGGASAPVGVGLKVGAMALDVGASLFRKFKQWGRDKKAAKEEKGEEVTGFFSLFDADKSTKKKFQSYNKTVSKIFKMIVAAEKQPKPKAGEEDLRFKRIEKWILALGMAPRKLYAMSDDVVELRKEMIKAQMKRE